MVTHFHHRIAHFDQPFNLTLSLDWWLFTSRPNCSQSSIKLFQIAPVVNPNLSKFHFSIQGPCTGLISTSNLSLLGFVYIASVLSGLYNKYVDIMLVGKCLHCISIIIARAMSIWMCAWYSPEGVCQEILSLGQDFPIHSLGSRKCIGNMISVIQ